MLNNGDATSWNNIDALYLEYNNKISANKFIQENEQYFRFLKESDYEFLVRAKYGDKCRS